MSKEENQQSQVSIETSYDKAEFKKPAAATQELSENHNYQTESKPVKNNGEDGLKALARLMMVSLTWSMAELSQRK